MTMYAKMQFFKNVFIDDITTSGLSYTKENLSESSNFFLSAKSIYNSILDFGQTFSQINVTAEL